MDKLNKQHVVLLSFATPDYLDYQKNLVQSAKKFGLKHFISKNSADLEKTEFYHRHQDIFREPPGFGYWLWKPYYILETLIGLADNEILFYADSGCELLRDPAPLVDICNANKSGIVAFDARPLTNAEWVKGDAFELMGLNTVEVQKATHVIATTMLFRKNNFTVAFVKEWLSYCMNQCILTDHHTKYINNLPEYKNHMADQAVFSLLACKHQLETYRNPSKWGNYLKMSAFRIPGEWVGYPYDFNNSIKDYASAPQSNSPFGTIMEFNRKAHRPILSNNVTSFKTALSKGSSRLKKFFS